MPQRFRYHSVALNNLGNILASKESHNSYLIKAKLFCVTRTFHFDFRAMKQSQISARGNMENMGIA